MKSALVVAIVSASVACAVAGASAFASSSGSARATTLTLVEKGTSFTASVNSPPKALSQGDAIVRGSDWMRGSKTVGSGIVQCWMGSAPGARGAFLCQSSITLPDGQIALAGTVLDGAKRTVIAIVGGTGAYRGARGQAVERYIDDESSRWTLTFETS
jgi:hypothetical protein